MIKKIRKYLGLDVTVTPSIAREELLRRGIDLYHRPVILVAEHGVTFDMSLNYGPIAVMGYISHGDNVAFDAQDWAPGIWAGSEGSRVRVVPSDDTVAPWDDVIASVNLEDGMISLTHWTHHTGNVCIEWLLGDI